MMPVFLEQISTPTAEDLDDLNKIYADYPDFEQQNINQWLINTLEGPQLLFAGRLNGRILAAIWASPSAQDWTVDQLCVRAITRRRGVARQLIELLCKEAQKRHIKLICDERTTSNEVLPILATAGFQCKTNESDSYLWIFDGR